MERAASRAIHLTSEIPRQTEPSSATTANVTAFAAEVMAHLQIQEAAV